MVFVGGLASILLSIVIGVCEQLQLKQVDGAAPLTADIQSNPVSVRVTYDPSHWYDGRSWRPMLERTWDLTVPASGIVTLTVPVNLANRSISMEVSSDTHFLWSLF